MAADDAAVVVTLRADLKQYESALKTAVRQTERAALAAEKAVAGVGKNARPDFRAMNDNFRRSARQLENDARTTQSRIQRIFAGFGAGPRLGGGLFGGIAAGVSAGAAKQFLDSATLIENALRVAGLEGDELSKTFTDLASIAKQNGASFESLAKLYSRVAQSQKELGLTSEQVLDFTSKIAVALKAAGTDAASASAGLQQLTQALASGVLRGDEFNSIMENLPTVARAMARGMDVPVGALRKMAEEGRLTADVVIAAFKAGFGSIADDASKAETTIGQAFENLKTVLIEAAVKFDEATGASDAFVKFLNEDLTKAINDIVEIFAKLGDSGTGAFIRDLDNRRIQLENYLRELGRSLGINFLEGWGAVVSQDQIQRRIETAFGPVKPVSVESTEVVKPGAGTDKAAERAAKKAQDKIQRSIVDSIGVAADAAEQLLGMNENRNAGTINAFLQKGGVNLNAATTAWCAAFVNSALAQVGIKGSGSNVATDFAKWGVNVQPQDVVRGDVLVQMGGRAAGQTGGHVGFATGQMRTTAEGIKQIELLSGNASDKVTKDWVDVSSVIARRASESAGYTADQLRHVTEKTAESAATVIEALDRETQVLQQQGTVYGAAAAVIDEAAIAKQALAEVIRIENDLLTKNIELTATQRAQLLASVTANLTAQERLTAAQQASTTAAQQQADAMRQLKETVADMATQAITGFVQDLRNGVDAAEALYNAVSRIADQLLNMALQMAFKSILGGLGGGMPMFASGGYTGDQPTRRAAGIVHGGEFVINAQATRRHRDLLEAINRGVPGYASGGFVLPNLRSMAVAAPSQKPSPQEFNTRTTVVNTFDSGSFLSEALSRPDGVNVILNAVRAQPGAFRQAMNG